MAPVKFLKQRNGINNNICVDKLPSGLLKHELDMQTTTVSPNLLEQAKVSIVPIRI